MNTYKRHRFPPDIISYRDIEDLTAERGITVSRETIHPWCIKFGGLYARRDGWHGCKVLLRKVIAQSWRRTQKGRDRQAA